MTAYHLLLNLPRDIPPNYVSIPSPHPSCMPTPSKPPIFHWPNNTRRPVHLTRFLVMQYPKFLTYVIQLRSKNIFLNTLFSDTHTSCSITFHSHTEENNKIIVLILYWSSAFWKLDGIISSLNCMITSTSTIYSCPNFTMNVISAWKRCSQILEGSCEHGNEPSDSIKDGVFLDKLSDY